MPEPITDDLIPEVRAALAKATPGPWRWDGDQWLDGGDAYVLTADCPEACCRTHDILIPHIADEDARLIANAPAWLEALCDEVERLRGERNRLLYYAEAAEDGRSVLAAKLSAVRQLLAEHPGSAWDSGIKLQAALKAALDGE